MSQTQESPEPSRPYERPRCGLISLPTPPPGQYETIGADIGRLVDRKQRAYGRSFDKTGEILRILYPHGIKPEQYGDLLAMTRILDKFFRVATNNRDAFGESPWTDVAGYGLLMNREAVTDQDLRGGQAGTPDPDCIQDHLKYRQGF